MATPAKSRLAVLALNSAANGIRAISGSLVTLVLPLVLVSILVKSDFAVWAICFSIASYVLYLDLGIPTTLQALVAGFDSRDDPASALRVVRVGISIVAMVALISLIAAGVVAWKFSAIFPDVRPDLAALAAPTLMIAIVGQLSNLLSNAGAAYFAGLQRSAEPTRVLVPSRVISLLLAGAVAFLGGNLVFVAVGYALPLVTGCAVIFLMLRGESRRAAKRLVAPRSHSSPSAILSFSGPLIAWNLSLLFVTGAGLAIVGRVDYGAVAAYAVANIFAVGITSLDSALLASLIPEFSRAHAVGDRQRLARGVLRASRVNSIFVVLMAGGIIAFAPIIAILLVNAADRPLAVFLIIGVVVSASLRAFPAPLSLAFVATGTHKRIYFPPILEAVVTFSICVLLGIAYGAVGVVIGSVVGAFLGMMLAFIVSRRLSGAVDATFTGILVQSVLLPVLPLLPMMVAIAGVLALGVWLSALGVSIVLVAACISLGAMWMCAPKDERIVIRNLVRRSRSAKA